MWRLICNCVVFARVSHCVHVHVWSCTLICYCAVFAIVSRCVHARSCTTQSNVRSDSRVYIGLTCPGLMANVVQWYLNQHVKNLFGGAWQVRAGVVCFCSHVFGVHSYPRVCLLSFSSLLLVCLFRTITIPQCPSPSLNTHPIASLKPLPLFAPLRSLCCCWAVR